MDENMTGGAAESTAAETATENYSAPESTSSTEGYGEPTTGATSAEYGSAAEAPASGSATIDDIPDDAEQGFGLVKDPDTGKVELKVLFDNNTEKAEETPVRKPRNADGSFTSSYSEPVEPELYTLDEFTDALRNGQVDERRVPEEYQKQYADFKVMQAQAEFTEKQQLAKQQAALKQAEVNERLSPANQQAAMKEFYAKVEETAKQNALEELGMTKEDVEDAEFEEGGEEKLAAYNSALAWHKQKLISEIQQTAGRQQYERDQQMQVYNGIRAFTEEARAKEPNFDAIDKLMLTRYQELPYGKARPIEDAINALKGGTISPEQTEILKKYYEDTRKSFYANRENIGTRPRASRRPPVVESGAGITAKGRQPAPDYAALRRAKTGQQKMEWLKNYFYGNER